MPTYDYQCSYCGVRKALQRAIEDRDDPQPRPDCLRSWDGSSPPCLQRLPSAPAFNVKGFNAANGYAADN